MATPTKEQFDAASKHLLEAPSSLQEANELWKTGWWLFECVQYGFHGFPCWDLKRSIDYLKNTDNYFDVISYMESFG